MEYSKIDPEFIDDPDGFKLDYTNVDKGYTLLCFGQNPKDYFIAMASNLLFLARLSKIIKDTFTYNDIREFFLSSPELCSEETNEYLSECFKFIDSDDRLTLDTIVDSKFNFYDKKVWTYLRLAGMKYYHSGHPENYDSIEIYLNELSLRFQTLSFVLKDKRNIFRGIKCMKVLTLIKGNENSLLYYPMITNEIVVAIEELKYYHMISKVYQYYSMEDEILKTFLSLRFAKKDVDNSIKCLQGYQNEYSERAKLNLEKIEKKVMLCCNDRDLCSCHKKLSTEKNCKSCADQRIKKINFCCNECQIPGGPIIFFIQCAHAVHVKCLKSFSCSCKDTAV